MTFKEIAFEWNFKKFWFRDGQLILYAVNMYSNVVTHWFEVLLPRFKLIEKPVLLDSFDGTMFGSQTTFRLLHNQYL